ncbi:MAG: bifunctional 2-polyprenyl-6-hydroxyphenol methylase/3-demethylubiquinol 3-O-methyltransferase UbiG [Alphaproteobacteria bacterium]|jgi:2-polyprenyl-6-hydroxyphenyl methylase/3-demethylubiquinone-9 3-methyltransferase
MSDAPTLDETNARNAAAGSRDPAELAKFAALADAWWDPDGDFRPLHRLNPLRIGYIRDAACERFGRDARSLTPLDGLRLVDIGCGGGLIAEPMARLGARVTAIDAVDRNIEVARLHAEKRGLAIDYRCTTAEDLAASGETFDIVLSLEIVEHVADPHAFLATCAGLAAPGGMLVASTLSRTAKAFALAIVGAEYVMRWLPRGTHDWKKFVRPSELVRGLEAGGATPVDLTGVTLDPLSGDWRLDARDLAVNYMALAHKD